MRYAYLLNNYDEHGPENCRLTLDRSKNADIVSDWYTPAGVYQEPEYDEWRRTLEENRVKALETLEDILSNPDAQLARDGHIDLGDGWGGLQITVIPITE